MLQTKDISCLFTFHAIPLLQPTYFLSSNVWLKIDTLSMLKSFTCPNLLFSILIMCSQHPISIYCIWDYPIAHPQTSSGVYKNAMKQTEELFKNAIKQTVKLFKKAVKQTVELFKNAVKQTVTYNMKHEASSWI